jgi:hypothetical protein
MAEVSKKAGDSFSYFSDLLEIHVKNVNAFCAAQQKLLDGLSNIVAWQEDLGSQLSRRLFNSPLASSGSSHPRASIWDQIDAINNSIEDCQENSNALTEIMMKSSAGVAQVLKERMKAALVELKSVVSHVDTETSALAGARQPLESPVERQARPGA